MQPQIHLIDETWIDADVARTSAAVASPVVWRLWWPALYLTVTRDRGLKGIQWSARSIPEERRWPRGMTSGGRVQLAGTVELWLEPAHSGVLLHHYLRLDPTGRPLSRRQADRLTRRFAWQAKRVFWRLKDDLEGQHEQFGP